MNSVCPQRRKLRNTNPFFAIAGGDPLRPRLRQAASWLLAAQLACFAPGAVATATDKAPADAASAAAADPLLATMQAELNRAKTDLAKSDTPPYYLSYTVYDQDQIMIAGAYGGLLTNTAVKRRSADVTMRVGGPALDNTHGQSRQSGMTSGTLPLGQ